MHPVRQQRPRLPSPFPYLPLTPQELLRAYLGIVGVAPHDSYAAQVTYNRPLDLLGRTSTSSHVRRTTGGDELPCADGKPRVRMHGGVHIVLAYRDAPEYAEGRRRWSAYEADVLRPTSRREIAERQPVPAGPGRAERTLDRVTDVVSLFDGDVYPSDAFLAAALLLAARVTTFALVHGAWHGAWCWERLIEPLRERGHGAIAVDLPCDDVKPGSTPPPTPPPRS